MKPEHTLDRILESIASRRLAGGGFAARTGGFFRADATAWAAVALTGAGRYPDRVRRACRVLADWQLPDGRVPLSRDLPETYWPTALSMLAWQGGTGFDGFMEKARRFLLEVPVLVLADSGDRSHGPDTSLRGWPWVTGTYSWVVPTATALMALGGGGPGGDGRIDEATEMLVSRQLPSGGWNYGDTFKFGTELRPFPETTGYALNALAGRVAASQVAASLDYLEKEAARIRTPAGLAWAVLGLGAWHRRPPLAGDWLGESFALQRRYGAYDTDVLAQMAAALVAPRGLLSLIAP